MPANEHQEQQERLDDREVGAGKELGLGQSLLKGEAVFSEEDALVGTKIEFDLICQQGSRRIF